MPASETPSKAWLSRSISAGRRQAASKVWRAVEAQHVVSTLRLADNDPERHDVLERILEELKPPVPPEAADLHYLLSTPFRYPPPPYGSRFRGRHDPGVFYGAFERRTACAEMGYWRWRFVTESEGLDEIAAAPQTLFQSNVRGWIVNLQEPPFDARAALWVHPEDYSATQALGRAAREAEIAVILYRSVRDPGSGTCAAVLHPGAFRPKRPAAQETWHLTVTSQGTIWNRDAQHFVFNFADATP